MVNPSDAPRPFCVALSQSVHWHTRFFIAALSIISFFLDFVSGDLALTLYWLLTWTFDFHCFGALGVRPRAQTRPHVWNWHMGVIIAIVEPRGQNCKSAWPTVRVFQPSPLSRSNVGADPIPVIMSLPATYMPSFTQQSWTYYHNFSWQYLFFQTALQHLGTKQYFCKETN